MEQRDMERVISQFLPEGREAEYAPCGNGHINHTFLVTARGKERYILQRISERLTMDAKGLMENISMVTEHLRRKEEDPRKVLTLVPTLSGEAYTADPSGNWRMYRYVERSICLEKAESTGDFYESA
ncbi:MAG: mucin desulfatase, partial [Blautia sp.]|nr:mucin desulfatase [Blautia sp.]